MQLSDAERLELWQERLDYYVSTGSPMTLNAEQTGDLRNLISACTNGYPAAERCTCGLREEVDA